MVEVADYYATCCLEKVLWRIYSTNPHDYMVAWLFGCMVAWLHGFKIAWLQGCRVAGLQDCSATGKLGYLGTWLLGSKVEV